MPIRAEEIHQKENDYVIQMGVSSFRERKKIA
jgi:hypothetical protein